MQQEDFILFNLLKKEIVAVMRQSYPGIKDDISEWKGQEIADFQEELHIRTKGHLSEKWFYSHIKNGNLHLPRIDVLNLLSRFAGYSNWDDFRFRNSTSLPPPVRYKKANRLFFFVPLASLLILLVLLGVYRIFNYREYSFCFIDADSREPITGMKLEVTLLNDHEYPASYLCDSTGCFTMRTDQNMIKMVVNSPYYLTDTIERVLKKFDLKARVELHANNYALMIRYFSGNHVDEWNRRKEQLDKIIADDALIYSEVWSGRSKGLELLSKQEFIDKLTMPSESLSQLEIMNTKLRDGKIIMLYFKVGKAG